MKTIKIKNVEVIDTYYLPKDKLKEKFGKFLTYKDIDKLYSLIKKNEPKRTSFKPKKTVGRKRSK